MDGEKKAGKGRREGREGRSRRKRSKEDVLGFPFFSLLFFSFLFGKETVIQMLFHHHVISSSNPNTNPTTPSLPLSSFTESITLTSTPSTPFPPTPSHPSSDSQFFYIDQIKAMKEYELTTLYVDFGHLLEREEVLARAVRDQYYR